MRWRRPSRRCASRGSRSPKRMPTTSACWSASASAACCTIEEYHKDFLETGLKRITPFFIPKLISNLAPGQISIRYGARGANFATTSACASGSHAIGEAYRMMRLGYLDAAITGGAEAALTSLGLGGFVAMRALSTRNDEPEKASRPFDKERDGFVMSEGCGRANPRGARRPQSSAARRSSPRSPVTPPTRRLSHHLALARGTAARRSACRMCLEG